MGLTYMKNSPVPVKELIDLHPQLSEKALCDFVNGIEVIDDHIRVREGINQSFSNRLINDLNGQSHLRQHTIDQHISQSLNTVSSYLNFLQHAQVQSDLTMSKVSEKLAETRAGVMRLNAKHKELAQQVIKGFERLDNKFNQVAEKLEQVDSGRKATNHLDEVFYKWAAGRLNNYPIMIRLYLVFDELYWGDFGNYCRNYTIEHEINSLVQKAKDRASVQLKIDFGTTEPELAWQKQLAADIQNLPDDYQQALVYLTDDATADLTPMLWAVNRLASGEKEVTHKNLPILLDVKNTINRFADDFEVRNAQQRF
jgi:hypothetical protein